MGVKLKGNLFVGPLNMNLIFDTEYMSQEFLSLWYNYNKSF